MPKRMITADGHQGRRHLDGPALHREGAGWRLWCSDVRGRLHEVRHLDKAGVKVGTGDDRPESEHHGTAMSTTVGTHDSDRVASPDAPLLSLRGITKNFGPVQALLWGG